MDRPQDIIPVPAKLQLRPKDHRGYPITYITMVTADGVADFATTDEAKRSEVLKQHKCALCGLDLDYWIYFIGGDLSFQNRMFIDPGMHYECAKYAAQVCPFISNSNMKYRTTAISEKDENLDVIVHDTVSPIRPLRMGIFSTRSYKVLQQGRTLVAKAGNWKSVEWIGG